MGRTFTAATDDTLKELEQIMRDAGVDEETCAKLFKVQDAVVAVEPTGEAST